MLIRYPQNPILKPNLQNDWEGFATFNGCVVKQANKYTMLYRAMSNVVNINTKELRLSTIGKAESIDGYNFTDRTQFIKPKYSWERYGCEDPRVTYINNKYYIFYTALANYPHSSHGIKVALAISSDLENVEEKHLVTPFNAKAMSLFPQKINDLYTVMLSVNTDTPFASTAIAQFKNIETLWDQSFWQDWYANLNQHTFNLKRVNSDHVEFGAPPIKLEQGWLIIYSYMKHYSSSNIPTEFRIEGVLLDLQDPKKIIGRVENPLLIPQTDYEKTGQVENIVFPEGALVENNQLKVYYGGADSVCAVASIKLPNLLSKMETNTAATLKCHKFPNNPLLERIPQNSWESQAVFNPAAVEINGKVYIVYRTQSENNVSHLGLAISIDGLYIDERLPEPIYPLRETFELPAEPGLPHGAEDPRLTLIDNIIYMCYTAHNGRLAQLAFTHITVPDFLNRNWQNWAPPKIISPPNIMDKDGVLFPEKINGNYCFFHRIEPNIVIDMVTDLKFEEGHFLGSEGIITPRAGYWDAVKIGINTPPIKTAEGWLVFYHGISKIDRHYRVGALLLELNDPSKVIGRTLYPILEPEAWFEKEGVVNNVVFPCGFVQKGDLVYLYYGGADKVVCGASISLSELLDYIIKSNTKKYVL